MTAPCALWHDEHVIFPSRSGMCELRSVCARFWMWHVPHVSISVTLAIWFLGETSSMTLWQFVQATSRDSCALPFQKIRVPLVNASQRFFSKIGLCQKKSWPGASDEKWSSDALSVVRGGGTTYRGQFSRAARRG